MIEINGSLLEGGGQILRMSLALSALCRKPVRISKIRAKRSKPGLAAQHLKGLDILQSMCKANVTGNFIGSTEITFVPSTIEGGSYFADTKTAGSVALLFQIALPVALFANGKVKLDLRGGTNAEMAPQIDFITDIFKPNVARFGVNFDVSVNKRGFFPKGGGQCIVNIDPVQNLAPINVVQLGTIVRTKGVCFVAGNMPLKIAHEMARGAEESLPKLNAKPELEKISFGGGSNCAGVILSCTSATGCVLGGSALGNRSVNDYECGQNAALEIATAVASESCFDEHTQDQLIIFMALAQGKSVVRTGPLTLHTKTAIHVAEQMTGAKFSVTRDDLSYLIECHGIGLTNNQL